MSHEMSWKTFVLIIVLGVVGGCIYFIYDYLSTNPAHTDDGRLIYAEPGQDLKLSIDSGDSGLDGDWYSTDLVLDISPDSPKLVAELNQSVEEPTWGPYYNEGTTNSTIDVKGTIHVPNEYTALPAVYHGTLSGHIKTADMAANNKWGFVTESIDVPIELHVVTDEEYQTYWQGLKQQKLSISKFLGNIGWGLLIGVLVAGMSAMPARKH